MAASLLRTGLMCRVMCLQAERWSTLSKAPAAVALSTKPGGNKNSSKKKSSDKKQVKTYFDIEKLVQHKPFETPKENSQATAAKPVQEAMPVIATPEAEAVKSATLVNGAIPKAEAIHFPPSAAEASTVATVKTKILTEFVPAAKAEPTAEVATDSPPIIQTVAEAVPVVEAVAEATSGGEAIAEAAAASIAETIAALPAKESVPAAATETTGPIAEAPVEAAAADVPDATEPMPEAPLAEVAPEPAAEHTPAEVAPEPLAEVSAPVDGGHELVDPAPVVAKAAGEELQLEALAEPVELSEAASSPLLPTLHEGHLDPIQKLFLDSIRQYSTKSQASGGLVDVGSDFEKALAEEIAKLQRLYGGGDITSFPEFKFTEPKLDEVSKT